MADYLDREENRYFRASTRLRFLEAYHFEVLNPILIVAGDNLELTGPQDSSPRLFETDYIEQSADVSSYLKRLVRHLQA